MILCASCGTPPPPEEIPGYKEIKEAAEKARADAEKAVAEVEKTLGEIPQTNYEASIETEQPSPTEKPEIQIILECFRLNYCYILRNELSG